MGLASGFGIVIIRTIVGTLRPAIPGLGFLSPVRDIGMSPCDYKKKEWYSIPRILH